MDEENSALDFKALRARFQDEEMLLNKQPRTKPTLPEKPRLGFPPPLSPTSPTHTFTLPAGARPSLLTSISQASEGKTTTSPRVVFKDEKKEAKRPLLFLPSKKEKSEGKIKKGKDKNGGLKLGKEKEKEKEKAGALVAVPEVSEEGAGELVPAKPPPKTAPKKKVFLGFRKSIKKEPPAEPILDTPILDISAPLIPLIPLIPAPVDAPLDKAASECPATPKLRALLPPTPVLPHTPLDPAQDPALAVPDETPPPPAPAPEIEPPVETPPTPRAPVSVSPTPLPPSPTPTPPPAPLAVPIPTPTPPPPVDPTPPPASLPPSPVPEPEAVVEAEAVSNADAVDGAASPPPSTPPSSPRAQEPVSPLTALERAEELSPGKKTLSCDQRILYALEKARRKFGSPLTTPTTSSPVTPTPEDNPRPLSPAFSLPELPPIDYGADPGQVSPVLEGIAEEGGDMVPELLVVPPPPPRKPLPEVQSLGLPPEKPPRPPSVDLTPYLTTPEDQSAVVEIPPPPEFLEAEPPADAPELGDAGLEALECEESVELQAPELLEPERAESQPGGPELLSADVGEAQLDAAATEVQQQQEEEVVEEEEVEVFAPEAEDQRVSGFAGAEFPEVPELVSDSALQAPDPASSSPVSQEAQPITGLEAENGYLSPTGKQKGIRPVLPKKRKGPPKNPYAETQPATEASMKTSWFSKNEKKSVSEGPEEKELKKKEKQRLEKEKREEKEKKEREKKEQKELEKKRNEMKKTFKITGQEEAMYQATVTVDSKGRKNDLAVTNGDVVSIIRTTKCPVGKWLAKDGNNTYGYISVSHVELDIKEMLELGKKASQAISQRSSAVESEERSMGSRTSNHYPVSTGSFSDDSEEWTCDDDDVLSPTESIDKGHSRTLSMPEMGSREPSIHHQHAISEPIADMNIHAGHEALQKLSTFLYPQQEPSSAGAEEPAASPEEDICPVFEEHEPVCSTPDEIDLDLPDMIILPPPDLYADIIMAE